MGIIIDGLLRLATPAGKESGVDSMPVEELILFANSYAGGTTQLRSAAYQWLAEVGG
jgi:hypothetical protein